MDILPEWLEAPWLVSVFRAGLLALASLLASRLVRGVLARVLEGISRRTHTAFDDALLRRGVARPLGRLAAMLVLAGGAGLLSGLPDWGVAALRQVALALVAVFAMLALNVALGALDDAYQARPENREHSIKGYVQLARILIFVAGLIVAIAVLIDRSPLALLAGLGAVSAVLLLVFKDTLMSIVASVQLRSNDMLRVGDWIEMPSEDVDGFVVDIALHTVKVQNWDKTVSTLPTWHLIAHSYRNWRGMYESGGRRIRRALHIDLSSVRFLAAAEIDRLGRLRLLTAHFAAKREELARWNAALGTAAETTANLRRLSNLGTFRAYMQAYVDAHPDINHDMLCSVRQLEAGPTGMPLQIYAYTAVTDFVPHENVAADIFDHLIAIAPEFGLRVFQQPTGSDLRAALAGAD